MPLSTPAPSGAASSRAPSGHGPEGLAVSPQLLARLKGSEGFRAAPYLCPAGYVTIGFGHNLEARPQPIRRYDAELAAKVAAGGCKGEQLLARLNRLGMVWTREHATDWLVDDAADVARQLAARCAAFHKLLERGEPARAEVLIDMAFNLGLSGLLQFKNTLACIERGDYAAAASGMLASKWASQVGRRANVLAEIMRTGRAAG